jgi:NhaP-type Na+/H+ and K+/H+ antiporter
MATPVPSVPMAERQPGSFADRMNRFLDQHVLPYPVKYLTNRLVILATLCLLVPLLLLANIQVFVAAVNSYLNVMGVVVSSTVLLYSTLSEARDRAAAQRREEIAKVQQAMVERRAEQDHELIQKIHDHMDEIRAEVLQHVNVSLDNIQNILIRHLESLQHEDHNHIEEMRKAISTSVDSHRQELAALSELVNSMHQSTRPSPPAE